MEVFKKTTKPLAIVAGVTAGILGCFLFSSFFNNKKQSNPLALTEKEKKEMLSHIKVTYAKQGLLSIDTVAGIFEVNSKLMTSYIVARSDETKKLRQKNKDNLAEYIRICEECVQKNDEVAVKVQKEVLDRLGVPEAVFSQSMYHYYSQNDPRLTECTAQETQLLAQLLGPTRNLSLEEFKPVFRRFTDLLEAELANIPLFKTMVKDPICLGTIINFRVNDVLFNEFGIQDEETSAALAKYSGQLYVQDPQTFTRFLQATRAIQIIEASGQPEF